MPRERRLKIGQTLFCEGDVAHSMFEVVSGVLSLSRLLEDGRRKVVGFAFPGDFVGFPASGRYHTDCSAIADTKITCHKHSALNNADVDADLQPRLLGAALREITRMQDHCIILGRKSAPEKTASFLLSLADHIGTRLGAYVQVSIPMSRSDIADYLGLTNETVSRTFSQLREHGFIALTDARTVILLQPDALRAFSTRG